MFVRRKFTKNPEKVDFFSFDCKILSKNCYFMPLKLGFSFIKRTKIFSYFVLFCFVLFFKHDRWAYQKSWTWCFLLVQNVNFSILVTSTGSQLWYFFELKKIIKFKQFLCRLQCLYGMSVFLKPEIFKFLLFSHFQKKGTDI